MPPALSDFMLILLALALDLTLGDPPRLPHPVRLIGRMANALEASARTQPLNLRHVGVVSVIFLALLTGLVVQFLINLPHFKVVFWLYFAWTGLALGQLLREGRTVARLLDAGDLPAARRSLAMLVSRDTARLDPEAVRRALAETLSENLSDGFVAPLFYLVLFGPEGMWVYKAVNTLDSMWGYRTPQYRDLGLAAATADDILSFVPARITAGLLALAAWVAAPRDLGRASGDGEAAAPGVRRLNLLARLTGLDLPPLVSGFWRRVRTDARKMDSPNAGWPMAAAAWLCGAGMGGPAHYFGRAKLKPRLGPGGDWTPDRLRTLSRLLLAAGLLSALILPWTWNLLLLSARGRWF